MNVTGRTECNGKVKTCMDMKGRRVIQAYKNSRASNTSLGLRRIEEIRREIHAYSHTLNRAPLNFINTTRCANFIFMNIILNTSFCFDSGMRTHKNVTHSSLRSNPTNYVICGHKLTTYDGVSLTALYFNYQHPM